MPSRPALSNADIASQLEEMAEVLGADEADRWRARAYAEAAHTVRGLHQRVATLFEREGRAGLVALPAIGDGLAARIEAMLHPSDASGEQLSIFDAPEAPAPPPPAPSRAARDLFESVPPPPPDPRPPIGLFLELDARFRARVEESNRAREERTSGEWLPSWHLSDKHGWSFDVHFSTSRAAQRSGRTHDWVVLEWRRDGHEGRATVVTEYRGPLSGRRVVRGRERECLSWWADETKRRAEVARWSRTA